MVGWMLASNTSVPALCKLYPIQERGWLQDEIQMLKRWPAAFARERKRRKKERRGERERKIRGSSPGLLPFASARFVTPRDLCCVVLVQRI